MATIFDYLEWRGDIPFEADPFNEVDNLILAELAAERKYGCVEVCVKKDDAAALRVYEKAGFTDTGYIDEDAPDSLNLVFSF